MKKIIYFLLIFFYFIQVYSSFDISSLWPINSSVIDNVGILNKDQKTQLETKIENLRKIYTVEILILIIPTTNWEDISTLAAYIWQKLWVWKKDKDNWLVLLISINDRTWNITTWYWIEWVLPDLLAKRIWEKNFLLFKDKKYFEWISWALDDFWKVFSWDKNIISTQKETSTWESGWVLQMFIAILLASILFKPLVDWKEYKKFFLYFLIAYIITLPLAYYFVQSLFFLVENAIIWVIWSILWIFWKIWEWWNYSSWWWESSWGWFWWFGWGRFGWWGSSWKW